MLDLPLQSWLLFAGAYLAGSMAWSAHAAAPASRAVADPLDTDAPVDSDSDVENGRDSEGLLTPLIGRGRLLRILVDVVIGAVVAFVALRVAPVATPLSVTSHGYIAAFCAALGHVLPVWRGFRGGSAAPVLFGALLVLWPWCMPVVLIVFLAMILTTGYLAPAVVAALCVVPLVGWWTGADVPRMTFAIAGAALVLLRNAPALRRIVRGEESRFSRLRLLARLRRP